MLIHPISNLGVWGLFLLPLQLRIHPFISPLSFFGMDSYKGLYLSLIGLATFLVFFSLVMGDSIQ